METKQNIFKETKSFLDSLSLTVDTIDDNRPWGGFFVINEAETEKFIDNFFPEIDKSEIKKGKLSPKILLVAPDKKLSWQYHFRRAEIWKLIKGEASISRSETDIENTPTELKIGETIKLKQGERHRLIGLNNWGVVAEIWIHINPDQPSNEDDIVRIEDDFGRK